MQQEAPRFQAAMRGQGRRPRPPAALAVALGALVFLLVSGTISASYRVTVGVPYIQVLTEKVEDYAASADQYDLVFLGSSQTFRHIDPATVDAALAQCPRDGGGAPTKSYNFGVPALREPELRYVVEQVLANRTPRLKIVVIQDPLRNDGVIRNQMSDRGRYFRGGSRAPDAVRDIACYTGTRNGLLLRIRNNFRSIFAEQIGLGRLAQALVATRAAPTLGYDPRFAERDGFWPADKDDVEAEPPPMTEDILATALGSGGDVPPPGSAACRADQLLDTVRALQAAGLEVVYLVSPNPRDVAHDRAVTAAVAAAAPDLPILNYGDPMEHPELFSISLWNDGSHMTEEGAELLSREVGQALCPIARGEG